ncbi:MAG TPA: protein kinase [Pyrinomonadaceae bacterium]|nr:protein kinase [Pyrinomonadaceae bacterium]
MADEDWQKVREVFDLALRQKPEDRGKFVNEACGEDFKLRAEVESLLSSLNSAENFLETPAVAKVADLIEGEAKKLERGTCFAHYEIIEQIGTGGMGEVYLARDKKLDRKVAIKILNEKFSREESNLNRFIREAKAASALNHPNILVIHEIGETEDTNYIVSEFIEGKTLREVLKESSLKLGDVLDISIQIAGALVAAHRAHLVHRDIKPENIMVRPDGFVKILDFGLAKLVEEKNRSLFGLDDSNIRQNQTAQGVILGTVNYMSPEQAKGEQIDERTDIFSFGVVIYEMLAGRTPFAGDSASATFANLVNAEPKPLARFVSNVPNELQRIVSRMIRKKRDERYQTMQDLLADLKDLKENLSFAEKLERMASPGAASLAVFPQAVTGETNKETAETQRGFSQKIKKRKWLFGLTVFAALVVSAILFYQWNLSQTPSARDLYLQGRFYAVRENRADNDRAIQLLEQAVTLDPNYALAYTELARAYGTRFFQLEPHEKQWQEKAYVALEKAFALAPDLAEAHEIRGFLLWMPANRFPHEQAIAAYRRAASLNPNLDEPHQALGKIYLHIGLLDEALAEFRKSLELNPGNTMARYRIGIVLIHQGKYEEALRNLKSTPPDINPAIVGRDTVWLLISLGRREEAAGLLAELIEKNPTDEGGQFASFKALLSALAGNADQAEREIRDALEKGRGFGHFHHAAYIIACAYAALNKPEESVRFLQMAADEGYPCYPLFEKDAKLNPIRENQKFQAFLSAQKRQWEYYKSLPQL